MRKMDTNLLWNRIRNSSNSQGRYKLPEWHFGRYPQSLKGTSSFTCTWVLQGEPSGHPFLRNSPHSQGWRWDTGTGSNSLLNPFCSLWTFSATQFRWIQKGEETEKQSWAIDHVYIGEACPKLCSGHGYCTTGAVCICDESFQGLNPRLSLLIQRTRRFSSFQHVYEGH